MKCIKLVEEEDSYSLLEELQFTMSLIDMGPSMSSSFSKVFDEESEFVNISVKDSEEVKEK